MISISTARRRIRRQSLYSRVAKRKPLIGPNNRYAIKYDGTKLLIGMCIPNLDCVMYIQNTPSKGQV